MYLFPPGLLDGLQIFVQRLRAEGHSLPTATDVLEPFLFVILSIDVFVDPCLFLLWCWSGYRYRLWVRSSLVCLGILLVRFNGGLVLFG